MTLRQITRSIASVEGILSVDDIEDRHMVIEDGKPVCHCAWQKCRYVRKTPEKMWIHIYLGPKHNGDFPRWYFKYAAQLDAALAELRRPVTV